MDADFNHDAIEQVAQAILAAHPVPHGRQLCLGVSHGRAFAEYQSLGDFWLMDVHRAVPLTAEWQEILVRSGPPCADGIWQVYPESWMWKSEHSAVWVLFPTEQPQLTASP